MLGETKSQKNDQKDIRTSLTPYETNGLSFLPYGKTNKLITALYMITDIMDKDEPLRNKLRNLGADIISDIYRHKGQNNFFDKTKDRISETLSFLEIASNIGIVSEMNYGILNKEFLELKQALIELSSKNDQKWLEEFIKEEIEDDNNLTRGTLVKGQGTRIGVQRGSTLLKALSDRIPDLSKKRNVLENSSLNNSNNNGQKNKRREEILRIIKDKSNNNLNFGGASIKDIIFALKDLGEEISEKTLQRELASLTSAGVLVKTGEKRWSKYNLKM